LMNMIDGMQFWTPILFTDKKQFLLAHGHCLTIQALQIPVASFYNIGDRKTNIIHTKLRHRCSGLNADLYRVNLKNDPRSNNESEAIHNIKQVKKAC
jgi:hypothetical protein